MARAAPLAAVKTISAAAAMRSSAATRAAAWAAKAVFYLALLTLGVWLVWYGQHSYTAIDCKEYKSVAGHPADWSTISSCALDWGQSVLPKNLGFLFAAPAVAALAAIVVIGLRGSHSLRSKTVLWSSTQLPPQRFWLWLCGGLTVKDALVIAVWAAYNAVWYSTILSQALDKAKARAHGAGHGAGHGSSGYGGVGLTPRNIASTFASLAAPNLIPLLFPVSRGSVISNALGISYPEGIRYHRWVSQWVLLLVTCHGLIYWSAWAAMGTWVKAVARNGSELSHLFGGITLVFALTLWITSQEFFRRRAYGVYKTLHHVGFWGFMVMGCAHTWSLFWYFVPGMLLYAVDGVLRLHQAAVGQPGSLLTSGHKEAAAAGAGAASGKPVGSGGVNAQVLQVDVAADASMCSVLLAAPEFGVAPAGIVWLNVPAVSSTAWHAFDYTGSEVTVLEDGRVVGGFSGKGMRKVALSVHIKAYNRWSKSLLLLLAQSGGQKLTVRIHGPYADPPAAIARQPDGVIIVAGGNGIASALPVLEELGSTPGLNTRGLPALLLWVCRKGCEFEFMAAPVLAAARALGLNLDVQLHITDADPTKVNNNNTPPVFDAAHTATDTAQGKDQTTAKALPSTTTLVTIGSAGSAASGGSMAASADGGDSAAYAGAGVTSMCPVVAFASVAAQMSFKLVLHLAVFGGFLLGLFIATYVGAAAPAAAGQLTWPTCQLGPTLVLLPAACALTLGLVTLWAGLYIQRLQARNNNNGTNSSLRSSGSCCGGAAAAAVVAMAGRTSQLTSSAGKGGQGGVVATGKDASGAPPGAALLLQVPTVSGAPEVLPVVASRPSIADVVGGWLRTLRQLPGVSVVAQKDADSAATESSKHHPVSHLYCLVYGCGPTTLDNDTQLAVAAAASAAKRRRQSAGSLPGAQQLQLQFVRKAQML